MIQLSIIIPVYNCADYLLTGFEKLKELYQYSFTFEIIYINDGSTDASLEILNETAQAHKNISIINQENKGASIARNEGIKKARGSYICFMDADDYVDAVAYVEAIEECEKWQLDVLGFRLDYRDKNKNLLGIREKQKVKHYTILSGKEVLIQGYNPSSFCVFIFRTELIAVNNLYITPNICHEDIELTTRIMLVAQKVLFIDKIMYHYVQRKGSFSKPIDQIKIEKNLFDEVTVAQLVKNNVETFKIRDKKLLQAIQKNYNSITWNLLWRFYAKKAEVPATFKYQAINTLKELQLYPIKGPLKSPFQRVTRIFFNQEWLLKLVLK